MATHKYNYFDALLQMTDFSCQAAKYLDDVINNFDPALLQNNIVEIHKIEQAADEKRHEIMNTLAKEFLPPIERADIVELASKIDDITDCIDDVMQHFYMYDIKTLLPECKNFSNLILRCCMSVQTIAKEFVNFRKSSTIFKSIVATNDLENEGDRLYSEIMRKIFTSEMSDKGIFIWTRIIASFETCCDYCEETAGLFESAIMKNS